MKIDYNYTKFKNYGYPKKQIYTTTCDRDICIDCIFDDVRYLLAYDYWDLPGIMSISKNEIIMSFDNIEIVISINEPYFNFENYSNRLNKEFEMIRRGI